MKPLLAAVLFSTALLNAQTLTEYAVAASGGASAGVAGKGVSAGLDKIFGNLNKTVKAAEKGVKAKPADRAPASVPSPAPGVAPLVVAPELPAGRTPARRAARPRTAQSPEEAEELPVSSPVVAAVPVPAAPVALPESSREALEKISAGMTRKDVIAQAGEPASRIVMDEDGRLVEVYTYIAKGESLGSIRLADGTVERVRLR